MSLHLLHLPVLLRYNPSNLLGARTDDMQEPPFIGGQSKTGVTRQLLTVAQIAPALPTKNY